MIRFFREHGPQIVSMLAVGLLWLCYTLGWTYLGYTIGRDEKKPSRPSVPVHEPKWEEHIRARGCDRPIKIEGFWDSLIMGDDWPKPNDVWSIERREDEYRFVLWRKHYDLIETGLLPSTAPSIKGVDPPVGPWELWRRDDGTYVFVNK